MTFPRSTAKKSSTLFAIVARRSEEHTSELQSQSNLVCRLLLEKKRMRYFSTYLLSASLRHLTEQSLRFHTAMGARKRSRAYTGLVVPEDDVVCLTTITAGVATD